MIVLKFVRGNRRQRCYHLLMFTSGEVGKRLSVHANTIRTWSDKFKPHLSAGAVSGNRLYTDDDLRVLATVAHYRQLGIALDDIAGMLADGVLIDELPPAPDPDEEAARRSVALVARPEYERALDRIAQLQTDLAQAKQERDNALSTWQGDITKLNDRVAELEHQLGLAVGKLESRPSLRFWLVVVAVAVVLTGVGVALLLGQG